LRPKRRSRETLDAGKGGCKYYRDRKKKAIAGFLKGVTRERDSEDC